MVEGFRVGTARAVEAMIKAREEAKTGVEHVEQVLASLGEIDERVKTIHQMNTHIATAAEEQTAVAEELNRNITQISDLASETSHGSEVTADEGRRLSNYAQKMRDLLGRFRVA